MRHDERLLVCVAYCNVRCIPVCLGATETRPGLGSRKLRDSKLIVSCEKLHRQTPKAGGRKIVGQVIYEMSIAVTWYMASLIPNARAEVLFAASHTGEGCP